MSWRALRTAAAVAITGAVVVAGPVGCRSGGPSAAERPADTLASPRGSAVPRLTHEVVATYPHDPDAFTQGLVLDGDGRLFESTGRYQRSDVREVDLTTGAVLREQDNDPAHFAEGLALVGDQLIQLTWKEHTALVWGKDDFGARASFTYDTEGWGLCADGTRLVMSDGTATLTMRDPATFAATGKVTVTRGGQPLPRLNELECVDGAVWANVWQTNTIVRIDPSTGTVTGEVDLTGLLPADQRAGADVLNGIAYRPATGTYLVTGKLWPTLFELRLTP